MGSWISWFFSSPNLDEPDPATGLTPRDKKVLQDTWAPVAKDPKPNGVLLFTRFFTAHQDTMELFRNFRGKTVEQLANSPLLRAHGTTVISALTTLIENLNDPDVLIELLMKTGRDHLPRKVKFEHFQKLKGTVIDVVSHANGDRFGDDERKVWSKALDVINTVIKKGLDQAAQENKE